jgi:uncharacterized membrane protein
MMDWRYGDQGSSAFGLIGGGVMMILFVVLAIWVVRQLTRPHDQAHAERGPSPLEVLDQRFARGEMPLEDYTRDREALKKAINGK